MQVVGRLLTLKHQKITAARSKSALSSLLERQCSAAMRLIYLNAASLLP
jgi:hypothetical protein